MRSAIRNKRILPVCLVIFAALLAAILSLGSCTGSEKAASKKEVPQKTFASPDDAGSAFLDAAKSGDQDALLAIFGPDTASVLFSGDAVKDKAALDDFVAAYNQMHRWREIKVGGQILYVGADNYAFPIPLGQNSAGQWSFDTAAGKDEILARRIGNGELTAIAATAAMSDAQEEYFDETHDGDPVKQYAQKFVSDEGRQNGLYWTASDVRTPSPLNTIPDFVKAVGYVNRANKPHPFNGYCFRILTKQGDQAKGGPVDYVVDGKLTGGFAVLAYPTEYRNSGIMTFIVGKDGVVYQKDLGEKTVTVASAMVEYNPGDGWNPALP
jgi:Protein of unknown function (DUF2950)